MKVKITRKEVAGWKEDNLGFQPGDIILDRNGLRWFCVFVNDFGFGFVPGTDGEILLFVSWHNAFGWAKLIS